MRVRRSWLSVVCAVAVLAAGSAAAVEVTLTVTNDVNTARKAGIVTSGIPFAKGAVRSAGKLSVSANGRAIPAQFITLAPWPDGSVRWALMDCQVDVPAGGKTELVVRDDGRNVAPATPVKVANTASAVTVSTGPLTFTVDKKQFNLFKSLEVAGKGLLTADGKGLVIYTADGKAVAAGPPGEVAVKQAVISSGVVCLKGKYPGLHNGLMGYTVRITAYAGRKLLKVHVWLENGGAHGYAPRGKSWKPEWFAFDGMAVELGLGLSRPRAACEGKAASGSFKVLQTIIPPKNVYDQPTYTFNKLQYHVTSSKTVLKKGQITDGVVSVSGGGATLTVAIRHFWQQYEKAIELDGRTLKLWLWPTEGRYPRIIREHPCPGYARAMMTALIKKDLYNMPGAIHKGHEMILDFSGRDPAETSAELSRPLFAIAPAAYCASTEAAPGLFAPPEIRTEDKECDAKLDAWMRMTRSVADPKSKSSIWFSRRDRKIKRALWSVGFWYGWMDFGDFAIPGSAAVSLHYDWPWIMMANLMRTGDVNYLRLGTEMIRHRIDIDQQWSGRERPEYRGFQRPGYSYAHFHCARFTRGQPNVVTNWLAGVVLYYMMTGDPKTLECINRNSRAVLSGWDRIFKSRDYYMRRIPSDMQAVARTIFTYCAMHGLTGDKVWLDRARKLFHSCVIPKWKNYGPHLHDRKQIRSQDYTRDDIRYCYSIQAFCLLHHLTGDKKMFELLKAGCDKEFPENFFDAPLFLADLCGYVALKTGNTDYLDDAVEHWIEAFPESKCPPVYMPGNSQWSRRKAMFMRTGHLLQYAHWKLKRNR